jgi:hypothetical protein
MVKKYKQGTHFKPKIITTSHQLKQRSNKKLAFPVYYP